MLLTILKAIALIALYLIILYGIVASTKSISED